MLERINIIIVLFASLVVATFVVIAGKSLVYLATCLIITILVFSIIGYFVRRALISWFEVENISESEDEEESLEEDLEF